MEAQATSVSAEARKGDNMILQGEARRISGGLRVQLWGGREVNEVMRRLAEAEGRRSPANEHGLSCWQGGHRVVSHLGINVQPSPVPVLGSWVLRAAQLGLSTDGTPLVFDIQGVHSRDFIIEQMNAIHSDATKIWRAFAKAVRVKREAVAVDPLPETVWTTATTGGGFMLNPELDAQLTAELQRMIRQSGRY